MLGVISDRAVGGVTGWMVDYRIARLPSYHPSWVMPAPPLTGRAWQAADPLGTVRPGDSAMTVAEGVPALITTPDTVKTKL